MQRTDGRPPPVGRTAATALFGLVLLVLLAACDEQGMEQETVQEPEQTDQQDDGTSDGKEQKRLQLGESVVLTGTPTVVGEGEDGDEAAQDDEDGEQGGDQPGTEEQEEVELDVTASQLQDPVTSAEEDQQPDEDARLVAVELELENVGKADYETSVAAAGELFLFENEDKGLQPIMTEVEECELIGEEDDEQEGEDDENEGEEEPVRMTLDSGESRSGCMVFEVEEGQEPKLFEYELQPDSAALWELT